MRARSPKRFSAAMSRRRRSTRSRERPARRRSSHSRWVRRNSNGGDFMISRRVFLKNGAFALVSLGFAPAFLTRTAFAQGRSARARMLIAIFQRGAVDGLSVVVPFGEGEYYRARPSIAIPRAGSGSDAALDLDGFFGLNPRLDAVKPLLD